MAAIVDDNPSIDEYRRRKDLWVAALRSGVFDQGRGFLRTGENSFCCLGVACEIYRRETGDGEWVHATDEDLQDRGYDPGGVEGEKTVILFSGYDDSKQDEESALGHGFGTLPLVVRDWFGLRTATGVFDQVEVYDTDTFVTEEELALLNDGGTPFTRIADTVESHPSKLFTWNEEENAND